jgi:hypothetical protein
MLISKAGTLQNIQESDDVLSSGRKKLEVSKISGAS